MTSPRYKPTYRQDEIRLIYDFARQGESLCFVGISGVGKSNITNFLCHDPYGYKPHYNPDGQQPVIFARFDGNLWDKTESGLWKRLLGELVAVTKDLEPPVESDNIIALAEEERLRRKLQAQIDWVCQQRNQQLMMILDDFDVVFAHGPLHMLDQLNGFRSAGNRGKLSYLIFTKRLPHLLGQALPLVNHSKFYDLFKHHIYALEPYQNRDARQMLVHLNENAGKPFTDKEFDAIEKLAGGHAGLLKIVFDVWRRSQSVPGNLREFFAAKVEVKSEVQRILAGLHPEERAVALRLAKRQEEPGDDEIIDHLVRRGLLTYADRAEWFSPLMAEYLSNYRE
jgi:hypothetical protein